jgi:hypothetical protein
MVAVGGGLSATSPKVCACQRLRQQREKRLVFVGGMVARAGMLSWTLAAGGMVAGALADAYHLQIRCRYILMNW